MKSEIEILKEINEILLESLRDILKGTPAIDRAEKTLRYLGQIIEAEIVNPNQESIKETPKESI